MIVSIFYLCEGSNYWIYFFIFIVCIMLCIYVKKRIFIYKRCNLDYICERKIIYVKKIKDK